MLSKTQIIEYLKANKSYFSEKYHIRKIGLFGSFAREEQTEKSDIDIIIERIPGTRNVFDLDWELQNQLKEKFNREIDICNEKYIKPYARPYILKNVIYV
jgi:uncharacterized protein